MAGNYANLLTTIAANIKAGNNDHQTTGADVEAAIDGVVSSLIAGGYLWKGIATPTSPGSAQTPDERVFYLATTAGTYTYLGGLVVNAGEAAILYWDTAWHKANTGIPLVSVSQNIETTLQEGTNVQIGGTVQNIGDYITQCRINADYSNILKIEHNTIAGDGNNADGYPARARTVGYISAPFKIVVASGYKIHAVTKYSKNSNGTITYIQKSSAGVVYYGEDVSDYLFRIIFKKDDDSQISDEELNGIISSFVGGIYESSRKALSTNFVNINTLNQVTAGYTLSDAIASVPVMYRKPGCIITFRKTDLSKWEHYQFNVGQATDTYWLNTANWVDITPATISDIDQVGATTQGVSSNREYLNVALIENNNRFLTIEGGTIGSGQNLDGYPARARTKYYIQAPFYLKLKEGFNVNSVFRYTLNANGGITYVDSPTTYSPTEYLSTDTNYIYRIVIKKGTAGTSPFTQNDLDTCIDTFRGLNEQNIEQSKWVACGDSITQGYYSKEGEPPYALDATVGWVRKVERITRKVVNNLGIGGTGWAHGGSDCARQKIDTWINGGEFDGASLVTFAYGVNDWKYNETLGTMDDVVSSSATNIIPSMRYVIERLMATYPELKIVVISPINCSAYGTKANNWGIGYPFSNNGTLEQVYQALKTVCEYYGIEYIDMLHNSVVNRENIQALLLDGVHPTPEAHLLMARELAMKINCY